MLICHDFYITTFSKASHQCSCVYIQSQMHVMLCSTYLWWVTAQKHFGGKDIGRWAAVHGKLVRIKFVGG